MALVVAFIGKPGSGKDTVSRELSRKHEWPLIVTGDLLRREVASGSQLGKKIAPVLARGDIVDSRIVARIISNELERLSASRVILLNGYPRTLAQAEILENEMKKSIDVVIEIEVSDETVLERLTLRRQCPKCGRIYNLRFLPPRTDELCDICGEKLVQREDDKKEVVLFRLKRFYEEIEPIRKFYMERERFFTVDGEQSVQDVVRSVEELLEKQI